MPKLIYAKVMAERIEVEVSDHCPNPECNADLTRDDSIIEFALADITYFGGYFDDEGDYDSSYYDSSTGDCEYIIGYRCAACQADLV
jgi:hypothetical protein